MENFMLYRGSHFTLLTHPGRFRTTTEANRNETKSTNVTITQSTINPPRKLGWWTFLLTSVPTKRTPSANSSNIELNLQPTICAYPKKQDAKMSPPTEAARRARLLVIKEVLRNWSASLKVLPFLGGQLFALQTFDTEVISPATSLVESRF